MHRRGRSAWAVALVVLVALWGLALIVIAAFLIAMFVSGQHYGFAALVAGLAVGLGAFITLAPILSWLRARGTNRLWPTAAPGLVTLAAVAAWVVYLLLQPSVGP